MGMGWNSPVLSPLSDSSRPTLLLCPALLLAACLFLGACGVLMQGEQAAPAGTVLRSFAREMGVELGSAAKMRPTTEPAYGIEGLDEAGLERFLEEGRAARKLLEASYRGKPELDALPSASDTLSSLARARGLILHLDRCKQGEAILRDLLKNEPRHVAALELLAEARRRCGDPAAAIRIYRELAAAFPQHPSFKLQLARVLLGTAKTSQASAAKEGERLLASLIDGPLGIEACSELCVRLLRRFHAERAEALVRRALATRPGEPECELNLGKALRYQGRFAEALRVLKPLADLPVAEAGELVQDARYQMLWCLRGQGKFDDALRVASALRAQQAPNARRAVGLDTVERALREEQAKGERVSWSAVELRYLLRKSPDAARRENALAVLAQNAAKVDGVEEDFLFVLQNDRQSSLRARALLALLALDASNPEPLGLALADPEPRNRLIAAGQTARLPRGEALSLLFEALGREAEPEVFRSLHERLALLSQQTFFLEQQRAQTPDARAAVVKAWAKRLGFDKLAAGSKLPQKPKAQKPAPHKPAPQNKNGGSRTPNTPKIHKTKDASK